MKVLFITTHFPYDFRILVHGVFKRMRMFIDAIKGIASIEMLIYVRHGTNISKPQISRLERSFSEYWDVEIKLFLCPRSMIDENGKFLTKLIRYGSGAFSLFKQSNYIPFSGARQLSAFESCLGRSPDTIFVHRLGAVIPLLLTRQPLPPFFFDLDDIEHIALKRSIQQQKQWYEKAINYIHLPQLFLGELSAIKSAKKTFICSETDRSYLAERLGQKGVLVIPNAVNIPEEQLLTCEPNILFIGSYSYKPNVDAVEYLIQKIWPRVFKAVPKAKLIIAGACPEKIPSYHIEMKGITFTGFVDNLDLLYRKIKIVCASIFSGGGTRIKIIEAAAYGKPVVSTRIGAEGLDLSDGVELLIRDNTKSFIEACTQLLNDQALCRKIGDAAREKVIHQYDRSNVLKFIQGHFLSQSQS